MTAPTTAKKTTAKVSDNKSVEESPQAVEETKSVTRIPKVLADEPILGEFCQRYLDVSDEIAKYNDAVLAEKSAEWTPTKVFDKGKELAKSDDATKIDPEIKALVDEWEKMVTAVSVARKAVIDKTAGKLGINLTATVERDTETELALKDRRKFGITLGKQLSAIAEMTANESASQAVLSFLSEFPMPAIGRDQAHSFGDTGKATPKYRVKVTVTKGDEELLSEDGFTKTALHLTKPAFGYERAKAPKADDLREVWEKALKENSEITQTSFEHNGLTFTITKK